MKIAVVTDDGKTISAHFGRAAYYSVLTVEDGKVTRQEQREKPAHGHHHHDQGGTVHLHEGATAASGAETADTHAAMVAPIRDCQVLLARGMGYPAYESLRAAGIQPIVTDVQNIDEAVRQYARGELVDHPERLH